MTSSIGRRNLGQRIVITAAHTEASGVLPGFRHDTDAISDGPLRAPDTWVKGRTPSTVPLLPNQGIVSEMGDVVVHSVGRDQVARLMRAAGLRGVVRGGHKTFTTHRDHTAARFPDLVKRRWDTGVPDRIWVRDFTYVWTYAGFCYVSFVTDTASRRILGWKAAMSKETPLVTDTLEQALSLRRRTDSDFTATGLIHHSDASSKNTSVKLTEHLVAAGMAGSIGTVGDAYDNALMESTIGLYNTELIDFDRFTTWKSRQHVETATARWVARFNAERLHSSLGDIPPVEYENNHQHACILSTQNA